VVILVVILLEVYFKQQVFLNDSVLLSRLLLSFSFLFSTSKIPSRIAVLISQIFQANRQDALIQNHFFLALLLILNGVVVVILGVLLKARVVADHTIASNSLGRFFRKRYLRASLDIH